MKLSFRVMDKLGSLGYPLGPWQCWEEQVDVGLSLPSTPPSKNNGSVGSEGMSDNLAPSDPALPFLTVNNWRCGNR